MMDETSVQAVDPRNEPQFDWKVYADATCAGLSALIPLPLLDLVFENVFRRRMPRAIAGSHGASLEPKLRSRLAGGDGSWLSLSGCLAVPVFVVRYVASKLWRKIIYVFAVTDAATQVSAYWHRAALLDHMVRAGHLAPGTDHGRAIGAFETALSEADTGSLRGLAREMMGSVGRRLTTLFRARRRGTVGATGGLEAYVRSHWDRMEGSMVKVCHRYNALYADGDIIKRARV